MPQNQALSFGLLFGGGILLTKAVTGSSFSNIVKGQPGTVSTTGASLAGGSSTPPAGSAGASAGESALPTAGLVGAAGGSLAASGAKIIAAISNAMGWGPAGAAAWEGVENREDSSYSLTAQNPTSSAYGEAQFIQGASEYASYGGNSTTQTGQLTAMGNYIKQRYGTPQAALAHEEEYHWY